jgi:hypothetical protein
MYLLANNHNRRIGSCCKRVGTYRSRYVISIVISNVNGFRSIIRCVIICGLGQTQITRTTLVRIHIMSCRIICSRFYYVCLLTISNERYNRIGLGFVFCGVLLAGCAGFFSGKSSNNGNPAVGVPVILGAQVFIALINVYKDRMFLRYKQAHPLLMAGYQGTWVYHSIPIYFYLYHACNIVGVLGVISIGCASCDCFMYRWLVHTWICT